MNIKSFIKQKVIAVFSLTIYLHCQSYRAVKKSAKNNKENSIFNVVQMLLENKYVIQGFMHPVQNFMLKLSSLHYLWKYTELTKN